jgi:hypothetical protein
MADDKPTTSTRLPDLMSKALEAADRAASTADRARRSQLQAEALRWWTLARCVGPMAGGGR